jgi:class 3 adenylate cyclase
MIVCQVCGRESPADAAFCAGCGSALAAPADVLLEERKVVTILFADLVGSTAKAERRDPEDVRATLSAYYAQLRSELERYGGTVEKFIGDAVMAVFGAPVAHEDDPERAVRAALAIRDVLAESAEEGAGAAQLDRALAFYRGVGATAYVRRVEAQLPASA